MAKKMTKMPPTTKKVGGMKTPFGKAVTTKC